MLESDSMVSQNPDPLKDPKNGTPKQSPRFPNVVMGSYWGGFHFLDPLGGLGNLYHEPEDGRLLASSGRPGTRRSFWEWHHSSKTASAFYRHRKEFKAGAFGLEMSMGPRAKR